MSPGPVFSIIRVKPEWTILELHRVSLLTITTTLIIIKFNIYTVLRLILIYGLTRWFDVALQYWLFESNNAGSNDSYIHGYSRVRKVCKASTSDKGIWFTYPSLTASDITLGYALSPVQLRKLTFRAGILRCRFNISYALICWDAYQRWELTSSQSSPPYIEIILLVILRASQNRINLWIWKGA